MERDTWVNWFDAPDSKDWPFQILQGMMITQKVKDSKVGEVIKKFREAGIMDARSIYGASQEQIAKLIFGVGIQNKKARYLKGMARDIIEKHGGKVPLNYKKLLDIKEVGPKIGKITLHTINQVKILVVQQKELPLTAMWPGCLRHWVGHQKRAVTTRLVRMWRNGCHLWNGVTSTLSMEH